MCQLWVTFTRVSFSCVFLFFFAFNYLFIHLLVLFTDLVDIKTIEQDVTYKVKPLKPTPPPSPTTWQREKLSSHTLTLKKRDTRMNYKKMTSAHLWRSSQIRYLSIFLFYSVFFFTIFRYLLGATADAVLASCGSYCDTTRPFVVCIMLLDCFVWWWLIINCHITPIL